MGFLFKAGFWFAIVLLFLPKNPETLRDQRELAQSSARSLIKVANDAAQFCTDQPAVCQAASQTSALATEYLNLATEKITEKEEKPSK